MRAPVRVLLLVDSLSPEAGTENQIVEIIRRMDRRRVQFFIACMEDGARLQTLTPYATVWMFPAPGIFSLSGIRQARRLRRLLKLHSIDIVHTFMVRSAAFGVLASFGCGCKAVLTSRRNLGYANGLKYTLLFRALNFLTTRVVANSHEAGRVNAVAEGLNLQRVDVIYNGVDLQRFSLPRDPDFGAKWNLPASDPVVGLVANLRPVKNQAMFLHAAQIVSQQVPNAIFALAGRGTPEMVRQLHDLTDQLRIADRVRWIEDDVAKVLPWLTVGCLSSSSESFSNSILEYMAAGLPVVATQVGGMAEAVEEGQTGFLAPSHDAPAFAAALVRLLQDDELRASMGRRARQRCQERFSLEAAVLRHAEYYESLAAGSH